MASFSQPRLQIADDASDLVEDPRHPAATAEKRENFAALALARRPGRIQLAEDGCDLVEQPVR
ncbi:MAG: hypothetical protein PW734_00080 [Verrucomicrobium sp.]|nr:hypothetical protein [Verrucomicrobium sp.]